MSCPPWNVPSPQVLSPPAGIPHSSGLQGKDGEQRPRSESLPVSMSRGDSRWGPGLQAGRRSGRWCSERSDKRYGGREVISFLLVPATKKIILLMPHKREIWQSLDRGTILPSRSFPSVAAAVLSLAFPFLMAVQNQRACLSTCTVWALSSFILARCFRLVSQLFICQVSYLVKQHLLPRTEDSSVPNGTSGSSSRQNKDRLRSYRDSGKS